MKESEQRDASFLGVLGVLFFQATSGPNLVLTVPAYGFDHRLLRRSLDIEVACSFSFRKLIKTCLVEIMI